MKPAAEFWNGQSHNHKEDPALLIPTIKPKDSERLRNFISAYQDNEARFGQDFKFSLDADVWLRFQSSMLNRYFEFEIDQELVI